MEDMKPVEYYLDHPEELTPEVASEYGITIPGDHDAPKQATPEVEAEVEKAIAETEDADIIAKDGKSTIPYHVLQEARDAAASAKRAAESYEAKLAEAEAQLQAARDEKAAELAALQQERDQLLADRAKKADAGLDTAEEDARIAEFDEDFPVIAEVQGIKMRRAFAEMMAGRDAELESLKQELASLKAARDTDVATSAQDAHMALIKTAHPDLDSLIQSGALVAYAESLPYKLGVEAFRILQEGDSKEIIAFITDYKATTIAKPGPKSDTRQPTTLSDFGGSAPDTAVNLADMDANQLIAYSQLGAAQQARVEKYLADAM